MDIYVDESGTFIPLDRLKKRVSVVAAVVLPQHDRDEILYRFIAMREGWPGALGSERKAREMAEQQLAAVFQLLSEYGVFVEACAIDMGQHKTDTLVAAHSTHRDQLFRGIVISPSTPS